MARFKVGDCVHHKGDPHNYGVIVSIDSTHPSKNTYYEVRWFDNTNNSFHRAEFLLRAPKLARLIYG